MSSSITLSLKKDYSKIMDLPFHVSEKKMYKSDPLYSFHNLYCDDKKQLQIVVSGIDLPISYAGNNAVLIKLRQNKLLTVLRRIEDMVRAAAPSDMSVKPLVKEPDEDTWAPSIKFKTDKCAVHKDSSGSLSQGCVLKRCLFSVSRLNHYQGSYYFACYLKSAMIGPFQESNDEEISEEHLALLDEEE